jgi:CelD/BcsL family acetyltransferase involved in cellulose biosynthesis
LRIDLHREIPDDPTLQRQWNALIDQMESSEVFYTQQWALSMQRAYGAVLIPFLVLTWDGDDLVGVAALATDAQQETATFLSGTTADYCEFLSQPSRRAMLAEAAFAELAKAGIQKIELANLPADSATPQALRMAANKHGYRLFLRPAYLCAQVRLGGGEVRASLKITLLGKKLFRRNINALGREGAVVLRHLRSWTEIEPMLEKFSVAHVARFLATHRISNLANSGRRLFLQELARSLSSSGWLTLTQLMAGSSAVAWNYGFQFRGSWFWYQPAFESSLERQSPGFCLLTKIVAEACDAPEMRVVDLGLGAEGYKERLANNTRATLHGIMTTSLISHLKAVVRYRLARIVKVSPRLESFVRTLIHRAASARRRFRTAGVLGFVRWSLMRLRSLLLSRDEVFFYAWLGNPRRDSAAALTLSAVNLEILATAAIKFEGEEETYDYLLRCAQRLRNGEDRGFALIEPDGTPVHFCWVRGFEGFYMDELNLRLNAPASAAKMIFDCWTPRLVRGHGYYPVAVARVAQVLIGEGSEPWIFSAASNQASRSGLASSGFQPRYSMVRQKILMLKRVEKIPCMPSTATEVPAGS